MGVTFLAIHLRTPTGLDTGRDTPFLQLVVFIMLAPGIACASLAQLQGVITTEPEASSIENPPSRSMMFA